MSAKKQHFCRDCMSMILPDRNDQPCHQPCPCFPLELSCLAIPPQNPLKQQKNTKTQWNTPGLGSLKDG